MSNETRSWLGRPDTREPRGARGPHLYERKMLWLTRNQPTSYELPEASLPGV